MIDNRHILFLLDRFEKGAATEAELEELDVWYNSYEQDETYTEGLSEVQESMVRQHMLARIREGISLTGQRNSGFLLWKKLTAAAVLTGLVFGFWFFNFSSDRDSVSQNVNVVIQDVAPGKRGATLTLASGKKIRLSDAANGQLAQESGVLVNKSADGRIVYELKNAGSHSHAIHTLSTAKGETYDVRLPDGTLVSLNAASSLTYSADLIESGNRQVRLEGEGYFEVARDKAHPFIVEAGPQRIEVLGTHFNVNAYMDEPVIKTVLLEGSIKLSTKRTAHLLKPGQEALLKEDQLKIQPADEGEALAWKQGMFVFNDEPLESIMRKLSRWYNVEVVYEGVDKQESFGGSQTRYANVSSVLKNLSMTGRISFRVEGSKIYVLKAER